MRARFVAITLFLLLGLIGVYVAAEASFQRAEFQDGQVLSAGLFNDLLNTNFALLEEAVEEGRTRLGGLEAFQSGIAEGACQEGEVIFGIALNGTVSCVALGGSGVSSLNDQRGDIVLEAGSNVFLDDSEEGKLIISAVGGENGGLSAVASDPTLFGDGTAGAPLGLADGAVASDKLAHGAVTGAHIEAAAVGTNHLAGNAVTTAKIADGAVTGAELAAGSVTAAKLAASSVGTGQIANAAITTLKLADGAVLSGKLANGAVTTEKLLDGAVTTGKIANGAIRNSQLADNAVTASKVASRAFSAREISRADGQIALSPGTIEPGQCVGGTHGLSPISFPDMSRSVVLVQPWPDDNLDRDSVTARARLTTFNNGFVVRICNRGASAVPRPAGYSWMVLYRPVN